MIVQGMQKHLADAKLQEVFCPSPPWFLHQLYCLYWHSHYPCPLFLTLCQPQVGCVVLGTLASHQAMKVPPPLNPTLLVLVLARQGWLPGSICPIHCVCVGGGGGGGISSPVRPDPSGAVSARLPGPRDRLRFCLPVGRV